MDIMGLPLWAWIVFYVLVLLMLVADLNMFGRKGQHEVKVKEALQMTAVWIGVSLVFCAGIYLFYPVEPHEKAMEFMAGYLIEKSLSMDNLFVFLMLFTFFGIERKYQHEVLFWGIFGALFLRSIFIFAGAAVIERFEWVLGLFGLFLLYTGGKMFTHDEEQQGNPGDNFIVRLFKRFFPVTNQMHGDRFFVLDNGRRLATPLFIALLVIETTDVAFAVDSIPAVFSVSRDPFIVLTSNIFAILGLRALYFALAAISRYFTYLKYGLGMILIFVGIKMLLAMNEYINALGSLMGLSINMPHIEVPTPVSLAVIFGILILSMAASVIVTKLRQSPKHLFLLIVLITAAMNANAQNATFARGADVSWCTEMEADNVKFCSMEGVETDIFALMKQIGMTAIRLRVWVNPVAYGYGAWSDKADVVEKAKRAKNRGLDLMIDFHYSDFFADPGTQNTPLDWKDYSLEQLKRAVAEHTRDVLQTLKDDGITPKWVQVGNETSSGMVWPKGKIDWSKSGSARYYDYVALSNVGYDAVKDIFPNAYVIVHHDNAYQDLAWFYRDFKDAGGKFDMIGLSHYPDYDKWSSTQNNVASNANAAKSVWSLGQAFNVPVMIVETGFSNYNASLAREVMQDLFDRMTAISQCAGIFYWEPQVNGTWKPQYYDTLGWGAYGMGAFSTYQSMCRPTEALDPFKDLNPSGITAPEANKSESDVYYDLQGRRILSPTKHFYIHHATKVLVK